MGSSRFAFPSDFIPVQSPRRRFSQMPVSLRGARSDAGLLKFGVDRQSPLTIAVEDGECAE